MELLCRVELQSVYGPKHISVYHADITETDTPIDIATVSVRRMSYNPSPNTMLESLWRSGIRVHELAESPDLDLRRFCNTWLSRDLISGRTEVITNIRRIACIEFSYFSQQRTDWQVLEKLIIRRITSFFRMLDLAACAGIPVHTISMPLLGGGAQNIRYDLILTPMLRETVDYLMRSRDTTQVLFIEKSSRNADILAKAICSESFHAYAHMIQHRNSDSKAMRAFISYSHHDEKIADALCDKLESNSLKVWYAKRNMPDGPYSSAITQAISSSSIFIPVISYKSMESPHVLSEVNLAFNRLNPNRYFLPLLVDNSYVVPAFEYYLNAMECIYAVPPTSHNLDLFVQKIVDWAHVP